jgi:lysophospholipase L1-like esterase
MCDCDAPQPCDIPSDLVRFKCPLPHLAQGIKGQGKIKIVAIGSSSTAGEGGIPPYPCRLEVALRDRYREHFRNLTIDVLNRGKSGEEAPEERDRFDRDVLDEAPVLVIWQVGANAVFHGAPLPEVAAAAIGDGLARLRAQPMDVVLMDLQYAPAMLQPNTTALAETMVSLIAAEAEKAGVNVFRRFALMKRWRREKGILFNRLIDPSDDSQLHQSEWSSRCVAQALAGAIIEAVEPALA